MSTDACKRGRGAVALGAEGSSLSRLYVFEEALRAVTVSSAPRSAPSPRTRVRMRKFPGGEADLSTEPRPLLDRIPTSNTLAAAT